MKIESKFINLKEDITLNDVDWVNLFYDFEKIFEDHNAAKILSPTEVFMPDPNDLNTASNKPTFVLQPSLWVKVMLGNEFNFSVGTQISKFMLLTAVKFNGDNISAISYISHYVRKKNIPYIRVGIDFLKVIEKDNRYGATTTVLKTWNKESISDDHGKPLLKLIPRYDDFTIVPNNTTYLPSVKNCYNLYSPFPHHPHNEVVEEEDIPVTMTLINHIFGVQKEIGLKYLKVLYEHPTQILPVLILVSTERETGKTTFLNWIHMIFGENAVLISPQDLTSNFNSGYATKNIIMVDETVIEKNTSIEKLKSLATAKSLSVSQKFVAQYSIPFFGKIILCTNKERDFMRVDEEEIRFWIKKINVINGDKNTNIELDLFNEIPKFLKFLTQIPKVDFSKSRMVFTKDEIGTYELHQVKEESKSTLRKEIEYLVDDYFNNNEFETDFEATSKDIKHHWFDKNHQITISYIRKVVRDEMKIPVMEMKRYHPLGVASDAPQAVGKPFLFLNPNPKSNPENAGNNSNSPSGQGNGQETIKWWNKEKSEDEMPF